MRLRVSIQRDCPAASLLTMALQTLPLIGGAGAYVRIHDTPPPPQKSRSRHCLQPHRAWSSLGWLAADDTAIGGISSSTIVPTADGAIFSGNLAVSALPEGTGFASQRTSNTVPLDWDLSEYDGLTVTINDIDEKIYAITLKNAFPGAADVPFYMANFSQADSLDSAVQLSWDEFLPRLGGSPNPDTTPLDVTNITQLTVLIRR